jgi:AbrB family looped-hinge helix DNA binding protein
VATIEESKLTSKGQVTIPEAIRRELRVRAGDRLEWRIDEAGTVRVRRMGKTLDELQGLLGEPPQHVTVEDMDEAVRRRLRRNRDVCR